jgi:hypothetical protein
VSHLHRDPGKLAAACVLGNPHGTFAPSPRRGEGWDEGRVLAGTLVEGWSAAKSFRLPAAAESLFSCVAKRKVTKREGHPTWRLSPVPGRQVREPGPGFSTGHPALAKRSRPPCRLPLRGLSTPSHRRTGAPGKAAGHPGPHSFRSSCAAAKVEEHMASSFPQIPVRPERSSRQRAESKGDIAEGFRLRPRGLRSRRTGRIPGCSERMEQRSLRSMLTGFPLACASVLDSAVSVFAFDRALPGVRAGCAPLYRGPCAAVRDGRQARRVIGRDADHFSAGQESGRKTRPALTDLPGMARAWMPELRQRRSSCPKPGKRQAGCRFLLVTSLLGKQKRSNSPSAGGRKLFALDAGTSKGIARERAPTGSPP